MPACKRACTAALGAAVATMFAATASAQLIVPNSVDHASAGFVEPNQQSQPSADDLPAALRRQVVAYATDQPPGTMIIDTAHTFLYVVLGEGKALRYGIGVGRQGFTWSGVETITRKSEWPDWVPPPEMIARQPYLPRWVGGGPGNPLGARALYLGNTDYRIHGTNNPGSIGKQVSSGCIRLRDADVIDLYDRVDVGTKVIVLANDQHSVAVSDQKAMRAEVARPIVTTALAVRPAAAAGEQPLTREAVRGDVPPFGLY